MFCHYQKKGDNKNGFFKKKNIIIFLIFVGVLTSISFCNEVYATEKHIIKSEQIEQETKQQTEKVKKKASQQYNKQKNALAKFFDKLCHFFRAKTKAEKMIIFALFILTIIDILMIIVQAIRGNL